MSADYRKLFLLAVIVAIVVIVIIIPIKLIKKLTNRSKKPSNYPSTAPKDSPYISVDYVKSGSLLDDGKCGWLDIECGFGGKETIELKFDKKSPTQFFIPLNIGTYRITYRSKSKAAMAAEGALKTINESSGAMGSFANAVFDAGMGSAQLSSVVVNVDADFVMKLACSTDGFNGRCELLS